MTPGDGIPPDGSADKSLGDIVADISDKASASYVMRSSSRRRRSPTRSASSARERGSPRPQACSSSLPLTMFFHFLAWFLNDLFDWTGSIWPGFAS